MKYFEMLKLISENKIGMFFYEHEGGIRVVASKKISDNKNIVNDVKLSKRDFLTGNNNYILALIKSVLDAEKEITLQSNQSP